MDIRNRGELKQRASRQLEVAFYDPRKLSLLHGAVIVGVGLVLTLLNLFLSYGIDHTGGLQGMGTRNVLQTAQTLLSNAYSLLMPFWQIGIVYGFIRVARGEPADRRSLTQGFYRFGPVLRLKLVELVIYFAIGMICAYGSSILSVALSSSLFELLEPVAMTIMEDPNADIYALVEQIPQQELLRAMLPMMLTFGVVYLVLGAFVAYRLRFAQYLVMDVPGTGVRAALTGSLQLTKGNCMELLKLDLSFWRYYLLQAVAVVISFADVIAKMAGLTLPISSQWTTILCYCLYAIILLALDYFYRPQVEVTYGLVYDGLKNPTDLTCE